MRVREWLSRRFLAAASLVLPGIANAQSAPVGMVDDPCVGLPVPMPAAVRAYLATIYAGTPTKTPPEAAAYRAAQAEADKRDLAGLCRYRADNRRLIAQPVAARRVVFLGDSITQGWGLAHADFFTDGIVNRGISGQTSAQLLVRFQADVVALHPRIVHIMIGTNDVAGNTGPTSAEDYRDTITAMVTLAKANDIRVILASIPPAATFPWKPGIAPAPIIARLNAWLRDYARAERLTFVDYHTALGVAGGAMRPAFSFDGVHPNAAGYTAIEPLARAALKEAGR